ncbi:alpha/beta hydrolase family esterase [Roseibium litorale]|uniref:alpha/beta hydrolase family esterase n=1 Tax=Roseibium litorale TaxID=2803841 RepID=UPI001AD91732|nr:hypothetical protein [Roseibium litorale]
MATAWLAGPLPGEADFAAAQAADSSCGEEIPCKVSDGQYYVHLPKGDNLANSAKGAIFFLHGHGGNALNEIRNKSFLQMADDLGVAFIAVDGLDGTWSFPTAPQHKRDEFAFFDHVLADAEKHFGINRERTLLSGFSSGAFMTWYLACDNAGRFSGYAPIAGAFWEPLPESCTSETIPYLFHTHGTSDQMVPMEGRWIGERWKQGDVMKSFDVWLRQADIEDQVPETYQDGDLACRRWTPREGVLELCLHPGGHGVKAGWIRRAWNKLAEARHWDLIKSQ